MKPPQSAYCLLPSRFDVLQAGQLLAENSDSKGQRMLPHESAEILDLRQKSSYILVELAPRGFAPSIRS